MGSIIAVVNPKMKESDDGKDPAISVDNVRWPRPLLSPLFPLRALPCACVCAPCAKEPISAPPNGSILTPRGCELLNHWNSQESQIWKLGTSEDFALCKAERKDGRPCTMVVCR